MKKVIIFLTALIFIACFAVGCKSSEVEELKEQVAELSEKLAEEDSVDRVEEVEVLGGEEEAILVPWNEAKYHIGEMATVYGPVVATYYDEVVDEGTTFLNIGKDYPDPEGFSVWIDKYNRPNFFKAPERYYYEKNISVTGLIIEIEGLPHMEVTDSDQISIDEEVDDNMLPQYEDENDDPMKKEKLYQHLNRLMLKHLNDKEYNVLRLSYGLGCDKLSAKQIADKLDIKGSSSYVRVSQLKKQAIDKLKSYVSHSQVIDYL